MLIAQQIAKRITPGNRLGREATGDRDRWAPAAGNHTGGGEGDRGEGVEKTGWTTEGEGNN